MDLNTNTGSNLTLSPTLARRLAITRQRLAGPRPQPDAAGILEIVRALGCLQLDPISAVARSRLNRPDGRFSVPSGADAAVARRKHGLEPASTRLAGEK